MRVVTFLLALIACAGVVYNHLQLQQIRQQVTQVQNQLASQQKPSATAVIVEAKERLQRALQLISAGKLDQARAELEKGSQAIAKASEGNEGGRDTLQSLQKMMETARQELTRFWSGKQEAKP